jgi:hypothetical protein
MNKIIIIEPTQKQINRDKRMIKETIKTPTKRVITETKVWDFNENELLVDNQYTYIQQIFEHNIIDKNPCKIIIQQFKKKILGYKSQDIIKGKYTPDKFVDIATIVELLNTCKNQCYYCKQNTNVLYENVREPRQWTLDRIDNEEGHNKNNLLIACLTCNLRRKLMHTERYAFTKQLTIIKQN